MYEINYVATWAFVEAMHHTEFTIEFFKLLKNGKAIKSKMNLFLETIVNPYKLTDSEIEEIIKVFNINFFKNNFNLDLKQRITGFMIRMNCPYSFCEYVTNLPLSDFTISPSMSALNHLLKQFFEPVVLKITTSNKSHCKSQIGAFNNITSQQFELIKNEKVELNRKMSKFEVWTIKKEPFAYNIIAHHVDHSEVVTNNHHCDNTDHINIDLVFDDVNSETIDSVLNNDDISNYFSSFCG